MQSFPVKITTHLRKAQQGSQAAKQWVGQEGENLEKTGPIKRAVESFHENDILKTLEEDVLL